MVPERLDNYLRTHRKRSGLTQADFASLLGLDAAQVSRYEKRQALPPLETAIACEAIFGVPIAELFAGIRLRILGKVEKRRSELRTRLQAENLTGNRAGRRTRKLQWLAASDQSVAAGQHISLS